MEIVNIESSEGMQVHCECTSQRMAAGRRLHSKANLFSLMSTKKGTAQEQRREASERGEPGV